MSHECIEAKNTRDTLILYNKVVQIIITLLIHYHLFLIGISDEHIYKNFYTFYHKEDNCFKLP